MSQQAYSRIRNDIIRCVHAPGSELSEAMLAERYGLGLAATRKALSRLTQDGLLSVIPRRGYQVAPITVRGVHDLMGLRLMLEPALAREVALRAAETTVIRKHAEGPPETLDEIHQLEFVSENRAFHVGIAELAGNAMATHVLVGIMDSMERLLHLGLFCDPDAAAARARRDEQKAQHRQLLEAILSKDPTRAERAARLHIEHSRDTVLRAATRFRGEIRID